jgi:hypothetical protein
MIAPISMSEQAELLQQLALRFHEKDRTSEAHEIAINHMTEKASEALRSHEIILASEGQYI